MKEKIIDEKWFNGFTNLEDSNIIRNSVIRCNCRLQLSDMGYLECELKEGHSGDHHFSHNGESWPGRKYKITWERDEEKDFIFKEEYLKEINFEEVFINIKDNYNILSYNYKFRDDSIYGATPTLWIYAEYFEEYEDTDEFFEKIWEEESKIRAYLDENLLFRGKPISRDLLSMHLSITFENQGEQNEIHRRLCKKMF